MFKAYFDDSTSDENDKVLVLAGCVQSYKVWADFNLAWELALAQMPSIRNLHMREARNLTGEFLRWKATDRDKKIHLLATIIEKFHPWTMAVWVSRKEHDATVGSIAPHMVRYPYTSLFFAVVLKLAHLHQDMHIQFPVEYVFDDQAQIGDDAALWYRHIKSWQTPELAALMGATPKFENDELSLPLQAADMLAWHIRRRKQKPDERLPTAPLDNLTYAEAHLSVEWLTKIANQMKDVPGLSSVQQKPLRKEKEELRAVIRAMPTKAEYERQKKNSGR